MTRTTHSALFFNCIEGVNLGCGKAAFCEPMSQKGDTPALVTLWADLGHPPTRQRVAGASERVIRGR
jgi:hypothetical protein